MKEYSVYLTYQVGTRNGRYLSNSISYKDILANDLLSACEIAKTKASSKIKHLISMDVSMCWMNWNPK